MPTLVTSHATAALLQGLLLVALSVGCSHHYVPRQSPIERDRVANFPVPEPVLISNAQELTEPVLIGQQGIHKFYGDMRAWTETAVADLRNELNNRGMPGGTSAGKELALSISNTHIFWGFANIRCITNLEIETGEGYSARFEGNAASGVTLYKACRVAVTRALALALNDPKILDYLTTEAHVQEK